MGKDNLGTLRAQDLELSLCKELAFSVGYSKQGPQNVIFEYKDFVKLGPPNLVIFFISEVGTWHL